MAAAKLGENIFKAYDVRGVYPKDLDETTAEALGCSFGEYIGNGKTIVLSRDVRLSSDSLREGMLKGLSSSDPKIVDIGVAPTPVVSFVIKHHGFDGGVMITASHNPKEWNGFKFYKKKGEPLSMESGLQIIKNTVEKGKQCKGKTIKIKDTSRKTIEEYERFLLDKINIGKKVRMVVDPGNGSYCSIAKRILEKAGIEVIAINNTPNGEFPARSPEPKEESLGGLRKMVIESKTDFGVGFDADGDRGIFVDGKGRVLRGDFALALFVRNLLKKGEKAVYTVSCSNVVEEQIVKAGGIPIMTKVGRTFIGESVEREKAVIGGEIAGHTFFSEIYNIDDPLFATLKMAELIANKGKTLAQLFDEIPRYETVDIELGIEDNLKFGTIDEVRKILTGKGYKIITLDGVKAIVDGGLFILRASNTTPVIRLVAEAKNKKDLDKIVKLAREVFKEAKIASEK